jgi:hypothetical protein
MNIQFLRFAVLFSIFLLMAGCASSPFYHRQIMAGQVVQATEVQTVVCIGQPNGAEKGQILDAYRAVLRPRSVEEGQSAWVREWVGKVKVDEIIDEHFASVEIVEGEVVKNDIVELE